MVNRLFIFLSLIAGPALAEQPALGLPLECTLGENCFVQQYMDLDETKDLRDFGGGKATYDGHKGTDFRLTSRVAMRHGVNVLASVSGWVEATRNSVVDRLLQTDYDFAEATGIECGNGVLLVHRDGWKTQYCHLKQGSIIVKPGQMVQKGDALGQVGLSGKTQFPHVHITVFKDGKNIDPFDPENNIWDDDLRAGLAYQPTRLINVGFADAGVNMAEVALEKFADFRPSHTAPALVVYMRAINLVKGDQIRLTLTGPNGQIISKTYDPEANQKAVQVYFAGKKLPAGGWPDGEYTGVAEVLRDGAVVDTKTVRKATP